MGILGRESQAPQITLSPYELSRGAGSAPICKQRAVGPASGRGRCWARTGLRAPAPLGSWTPSPFCCRACGRGVCCPVLSTCRAPGRRAQTLPGWTCRQRSLVQTQRPRGPDPPTGPLKLPVPTANPSKPQESNLGIFSSYRSAGGGGAAGRAEVISLFSL